MALKAPHLFAAVIIAWSTPRLDLNRPDYESLKNIDQMVSYHFLNVDDYSFNFARLWNTQKYFPKAKSWKYGNLSHIEAEVMFDSFDYNNLFFSDAILYHRDVYYSFRNDGPWQFLKAGSFNAEI